MQQKRILFFPVAVVYVYKAASKQSANKARGKYAKFTPKQQVEVAKYASMHGIAAAQRRFSKEFDTELKENTV